MRKIGTIVAVAALAAAAFSPLPSAAFGLRIGPFYLGIPHFGYRHRHHDAPALRDEASLKTVPPGQGAASAQGPASPGLMSPLLYPVLALPAVYDEIFSPPSASPWPFSYDAILQTAFAKTAPDQNAAACPQPNRQSAVAERIRAAIRPTGNQLQQMQKLGGALGFASDYLAKACPGEIPQDPAARLQLMEWQTEKLAEALDFVRPPLQELEQSLNDTQRARFGVPLSTATAAVRPGRANIIAPACAVAPTRVDASIEQISLAVQPTYAQRDAMDGLKQAFRNAANELDANCPLSLPSDPLARLGAIEARLDATWRALVSIQTALADFETKLSADQRVRFDATDFAAAQ
ncbi:MAG: Spy/CpxP family protein refolding chaperone [Xanthobacteraceae bacterium]